VTAAAAARALLLAAAAAPGLGCGEPAPAAAPPAGSVAVVDLVAETPRARVQRETGRIDVGAPAARGYLESGWSSDENAGGVTTAWGVGDASTVQVFLARPRPVELVFRCEPFVEPGGAPQTVSLAVNGRSIGEAIELEPGMREYTVAVPAGALIAGHNEIRFDYRRSRRPAEVLVGSDDRRSLAVFWDWIALRGVAQAARPRVLRGGARPRIVLPAGSQVDYFLRLPPRAGVAVERVEAGSRAARTDGPLRLEIEVQRGDAGEPVVVALDAGAGGRGVYVPFDDGDRSEPPAVRLSFRAVPGGGGAGGGGELVLVAPRVVAAGPPAAGGPPRAPPSPATAVASPGAPRPPVVVYLIDTLRADHLGCYGYGEPTSPRIDRFAADAVRFSHAIAQSSWTRSSVASLLTGLYPRRHDTVGRADALPDEADTLAERLSRLGYATAAFSTNGNVSRVFGFAQGFDLFRSLPEGRTLELHQLSDRLNEAAFPWLGERPEAPFFLYLHATDPHAPYTPPEPFRGRFAAGVDPALGGIERLRALSGDAEPEQPDLREVLIRLYDGEIAFNDHQFGRLLDRLEALGLYDDALIVLTADHGEEFLDHGGWQHGRTLFQEQLAVPLLVKLPGGRAAGTVVETRVEQVDLIPTVLDLLGEPPPAGLDGRSLLPAIRSPRRLETAPVYAHLDLDGRRLETVIDGDLKLIRRLTAGPAGRRLFDLGADASERHDLSRERGVTAGLLESLLLARRRPVAVLAATEATPDEELAERLRALGYLD
jgi:arylsulfatase A-like enzyme